MINDILIFEDGKVCITHDGLDIPEVKSFYDSDKKHNKPKFSAYMKALYYIHSIGSPYINMELSERINRVEDRHVGMRKWSVMLNDPLFKKVVDVYMDIITTKEERQYSMQFDRILKDIDDTVDNLQKISMRKKTKVQADILDPVSGEITKQWVEIDMLNMSDRLEAQKALKTMFEFQDYIKERMKRKDVTVQKKKYVPLFDNPKS